MQDVLSFFNLFLMEGLPITEGPSSIVVMSLYSKPFRVFLLGLGVDHLVDVLFFFKVRSCASNR